MKYRLRESKNDLAIYNEDSADIEGGIEKDFSRMSFHRSHTKPLLVMGCWPGIALWKIKVLFTTDVEKDITYKTEEVKNKKIPSVVVCFHSISADKWSPLVRLLLSIKK
jgi:hypothetical protein